MSYSAKDLLYGFHFSLSFRKRCAHYFHPFQCIIRMVDNTKPQKNYKFPALGTKNRLIYNVCVQLPNKCNDSQKMIIMRLLDKKNNLIFMICLHIGFLLSQRIKIIRKNQDFLSIPTVCGHDECLLSIKRLGSKIANKPIPNNSFQVDKINHHNNLFLSWVKLHSLDLDNIILNGPVNVPFYTLLYMDMSLDHDSMEMEGNFSKTYIYNWKKEAQHVSKIVSMLASKSSFAKFIIWLDLMMGNLKKEYDHNFEYPQCNENKTLIDIVGCRMSLIDFIYSKKIEIFCDLRNHCWPIIAIIKDINSKERYITCGLGRKKFLDSIVINTSTFCDENDVYLGNFYPFCRNKNISCYTLEMLCWRDYSEGILVCCVIKQSDDKISLFVKSSGEIVCNKTKITGIKNVWTDCQIRDIIYIPMIINSAKTLRPLLCTHTTLNLIKKNIVDIKTDKDELYLPWQIGWIDKFTCEWERMNSHFPLFLDNPLGFYCSA